MKIGLVGAPSQGKSTFFKAATLAEVEIANDPFTTIKPNTGTGYVKVDCVDKEFKKQCNPRMGYCIKGFRFVPVELFDVAGLVPGAHEGKGMGNQFLEDIRQTDALIHVIDISGKTNEKGEIVENHDPAINVQFLEVELDMWYFGILNKGWEKLARTMQQEKGTVSKVLAKQLNAFNVDEDMVKFAINKFLLDIENPIKWSSESLLKLAKHFREKTKPMIVACNKIDLPSGKENFERLKKEFPTYKFVACSSDSEIALKEASKHGLIEYVPGDNEFTILDNSKLNDKQKKALSFIKENVLDTFGSTGVQEILDRAVFELLEYKAIYPGGVGKLTDSEGRVLPDCFLMPGKATALDFAYKLHTDFGKNFVKAVNVKTRLPVGKDFVLSNRDVIEIMSSK